MARSEPVRVGFIGLGSQGAPMARRIVEAGFPLTLWARRLQSLEPFEDSAATVASTPAALAQASTIVCIYVTGDEDVLDVVNGAEGVLSGLAAGGTLIVHSTVHPETCVRLHLMGEEKGITVLDAPVSGGAPAAAQGTLLVMVSGDEVGLDRARPVLATFGDPILHLGDIGAGQTAKLVNNLVFTAQIALLLETSALADELGLDRVAMAHVFERGSGASRAASLLSAPGFDIGGLGRVAGPLLRKDVGLLPDVARRRQIAAPQSVVTLADEGLRRLHTAAQESVSPRDSVMGGRP
jgi:3-hydroxyisobutyrate dehydrogenase